MRTIIIACLLLAFIGPLQTQAQQCPGTGGGKDYSGQNLTDFNFNALPAGALVGANFTNAILNGAQLQNADLTNANFSGATMLRSSKGLCDLSGAMLDHTCFQNARMDSASLQFATFKATNLINASLLATSFGPGMKIQASGDGIRTSFVNTMVDFDHFPINRWPREYWGYTDLTNARIAGISSQNFSFRGKDISNAILRGMSFANYDFRGCIMTGADLSGANLDYALLDSATMYGVKLVEARLNYARMSRANLFNPARADQYADLSGAVLNNATIRVTNFSNAQMRGASMLGATADSCNFSNASFQSQDGYNVASFSGANVSNSDFSAAHLNGVNLSNAYIIRGKFNKLTLMGTNFSGATMPGADFQDCTLQGVLFTGAILQQAIFTGATMTSSPGSGSGVDFSCTQLGGANFSNATVTQAIFADAVMPVADSCCQTPRGAYCGIIAINQDPYGATTLPNLTSKVTCPNGDYDTCKGAQWVIPRWRTSNCNKDHETQTVWFKPDCSGRDTSGVITFADPNLQACIISQLFGSEPGRVVTRDIAAQVLSISCPGRNIANPEGLQYFTQLQKLDLSANKLTDGSFFTKLKKLNTLKLGQNQLAQLNLYGVTKLNYLDASNNVLNTLLLDANSSLGFLDLSYNQFTALDDVQYQSGLNYLDLSNNKLTDIGDLGGLSRITTIYLQNNSLKTIGSIAGLYNNGSGSLMYLNLSCNLPFQCETLGLAGSPKATNFLSTTQCGINNLPDCRSRSNPKRNTPR